jgi:exodeoxyribonuclease V alpha subunit
MDNWFKYLELLKQEGEIGTFEIEFAKFINKFEKNPTQNLLSCSILAVNDQIAGNICTDLSLLDSSMLASRLKLTSVPVDSLTEELRALQCVGSPGEYKPFILEGTKLYLHKYWVYENELVKWLREKALSNNRELSANEGEIIESQFSSSNENELDLQKIATSLALMKDLLIISGGPGTGKTYTVHKIIQALKYQDDTVSIALAAPTGKAAERLSESLVKSQEEIEASTLHKLLGARRNGEFKFNAENHLPFDVVIVDEASMLDIRLWISLTRALKESTKLILLGDKDQLASVEAGSVLGDICSNTDNSFSGSTHNSLKIVDQHINKGSSPNILNNHVVLLEKSYRTKSNSGISELGKAINNQKVEEVFQIIKDYKQVDIKPPSPSLLESLIESYVSEIISADNNSQFLCSNKKGVLGTHELNRRIEQEIKKTLKIRSSKEWYVGRRIIITKNSSSTGLKNGEIGECYKKENEELYIRFGALKSISVSQLKYFDLAYAITVHKSQGSEFSNVILFLPDKINPVLTKELLYTGVTRAKENTLVIGKRELIAVIIEKKIKRISSIPTKIIG